MKRILILGASGTFGKALVEKLSNDKECHLTLASRHASACYQESERCHVVDCDAMNEADLQQVMKGCDVVYCAISGYDLPVIVANTVSAMKKKGVRRLIFMGAVGIYNEIPVDMDDDDNVRNNPDQIPNRKAADIVENSGLDYTILRPGYLQDGDKDDFTLTFKGEQAKGYVSTIPSVVELAVRLINDDTLYLHQSVSITRNMSTIKKQ
ncbi:NAD(P)H-binding protein [Butyricimonas virosa]|uniref:NAD(P)H-binding protein n=1 Tax=Butyricimonas virosa TaxID=544645 RepID=UPI003AAE5739